MWIRAALSEPDYPRALQRSMRLLDRTERQTGACRYSRRCHLITSAVYAAMIGAVPASVESTVQLLGVGRAA